MKTQSKKTEKNKKVAFTFLAPHASEVSLLGDFNQWNGNNYQMKKGKNGAWKKTVILEPGTYEYKYFVDGNWQEDPENNHHRLNVFGTYNNVVSVE